MAKISNKSGEEEEELPEYQPLVENTKPRDRIDSLPGYRTLSVGQRPNQASNQGVRSSNYLSLIQDDTEEGRNYQTLVKDANPQVSRFNAQNHFSEVIDIQALMLVLRIQSLIQSLIHQDNAPYLIASFYFRHLASRLTKMNKQRNLSQPITSNL